MSTTSAAAESKDRAYRRRLAARGRHQFIADLRRETVVYLDELKRHYGLRSRSQVLDQLIEQGRRQADQK